MINALKSFKGGVAVPHHKHTENCQTVKMILPKKVVIPMLQHIGAPCNPLVKKGDKVKVGQKIGDRHRSRSLRSLRFRSQSPFFSILKWDILLRTALNANFSEDHYFFKWVQSPI